MNNKTKHFLTVVIGFLILISGIRGLMGIGSKGYIPDELYVLFGIFAIGFGIYKYVNTSSKSQNDLDN